VERQVGRSACLASCTGHAMVMQITHRLLFWQRIGFHATCMV